MKRRIIKKNNVYSYDTDVLEIVTITMVMFAIISLGIMIVM